MSEKQRNQKVAEDIHMFKEYTFTSANLQDEIYGIAYSPEASIKGYIQIVHDKYDHISRYRELMIQLADHGYVAFGCDLCGHGKSAKALGSIQLSNPWQLIEDNHQMFLYVFNDYKIFPETIEVREKDKQGNENIQLVKEPVMHIMLGIGFGCVLARNYCMRFNDVNVLIFCGDEGFPTQTRKYIKAYNKAKKALGDNECSTQLKAFMEENIIDYPESDKEWHAYRSSEIKEIRKVKKDPACNFDYTIQSYGELLNQQLMLDLDTWITKYPKYLPLYVMAGYLDPISNYTKNIDPMLSKLKASSAQNIFYKYYANSRHELFFDQDRSAVIKDVLTFIKACARQQREPFERLKKLNRN